MEKAAGFLKRGVIDEIGDGGTTERVGAGAGDEAGDGAAPEGNEADSGAGAFAKSETCCCVDAECGKELCHQPGAHGAAGGVDDQADHEALQSEENRQVSERYGLEADNSADGAEGLQEL